jgi:hypothetical protein
LVGVLRSTALLYVTHLMHLVAYRPEYRIYLDTRLNMLLYEQLEEMTFAKQLPYYLRDWQQALEQVQPSFTVLYDVRRTLGPNTDLLPAFFRSYWLMLAAGIAMLAEVHPAGSMPMPVNRILSQLFSLPTRQFTDVTAAEDFLLGYGTSIAS